MIADCFLVNDKIQNLYYCLIYLNVLEYCSRNLVQFLVFLKNTRHLHKLSKHKCYERWPNYKRFSLMNWKQKWTNENNTFVLYILCRVFIKINVMFVFFHSLCLVKRYHMIHIKLCGDIKIRQRTRDLFLCTKCIMFTIICNYYLWQSFYIVWYMITTVAAPSLIIFDVNNKCFVMRILSRSV